MKFRRVGSSFARLVLSVSLGGCVSEQELGPASCVEPDAEYQECRPRADDLMGIGVVTLPAGSPEMDVPCTVTARSDTQAVLNHRDLPRSAVSVSFNCKFRGLSPSPTGEEAASLEFVGYPSRIPLPFQIGEEVFLNWKSAIGASSLLVRDADGELLAADFRVGDGGAGTDTFQVQATVLPGRCRPEPLDWGEGETLHFQRYGVAFETDEREENVVLFEGESGELMLDGGRYVVSVYAANDVLCCDFCEPQSGNGFGELRYSVVAVGQ